MIAHRKEKANQEYQKTTWFDKRQERKDVESTLCRSSDVLSKGGGEYRHIVERERLLCLLTQPVSDHNGCMIIWAKCKKGGVCECVSECVCNTIKNCILFWSTLHEIVCYFCLRRFTGKHSMITYVNSAFSRRYRPIRNGCDFFVLAAVAQ